MKKPIHYLVFKILAAVFLVVTVVGLILLFTGFGDFETDNYLYGIFILPVGFGGMMSFAFLGFKPEIAKMSARSARYIQEQNKEDLQGLASTGAEIHSEAVKTTARAVKEVLSDTKYCKHCGAKIDEDSRFCKECGGEQ